MGRIGTAFVASHYFYSMGGYLWRIVVDILKFSWISIYQEWELFGIIWPHSTWIKREKLVSEISVFVFADLILEYPSVNVIRISVLLCNDGNGKA